MNAITLFSTNCPKCVVLEQRLRDVGVEFTVCNNMTVMRDRGFVSAPMLEVDGQMMDFVAAIQWLQSKTNESNGGK